MVRYLAGTKTLRLKMSSTSVNDNRLVTTTDADWAEDRVDRKSNSGYVVQLNGGTISWCCRKQNIVTQSSAEAEFVAMTEAVKEAMWIKEASSELCEQGDQPLLVFTDSQSAMAMTDNQNFSNRTKHVDIKYHFVKDMVKKNELKLCYVPTDVNVADIMTKPLGETKTEQLRRLVGLE